MGVIDGVKGFKKKKSFKKGSKAWWKDNNGKLGFGYVVNCGKSDFTHEEIDNSIPYGVKSGQKVCLIKSTTTPYDYAMVPASKLFTWRNKKRRK